MNEFLKKSDEIQGDVKLLTFEFILKPFAKMSPDKMADYARRQYPAVSKWYDTFKARPSYSQSVSRLEPAGMRAAFMVYRTVRRTKGTGVSSFA